MVQGSLSKNLEADAINTASASNLGHHLGAFKKKKGPLVMHS